MPGNLENASITRKRRISIPINISVPRAALRKTSCVDPYVGSAPCSADRRTSARSAVAA